MDNRHFAGSAESLGNIRLYFATMLVVINTEEIISESTASFRSAYCEVPFALDFAPLWTEHNRAKNYLI